MNVPSAKWPIGKSGMVGTTGCDTVEHGYPRALPALH